MTHIEAMKLALEAFQVATTPLAKDRQEVLRAIKALEEALAKQEQGEPVAWVDFLKDAEQIVKDKFLYKRFIDGTPLANDIPCWMADFAQQYTTPQQRTWVGLKEKDVNELCCTFIGQFNKVDFIKGVEAKLKEKNT